MANPRGQQRDKPFRDALRMELAAAGEDHKALRQIARNLIELACASGTEALPAIKEVADRMDGKAVQAMEIGEPGAFDSMADNELMAQVREEAASLGITLPKPKPNGRSNGTAH